MRCGTRWPYVLFSASPSGNDDYAATVASALAYWDKDAPGGRFVFTSSAGVCAEQDGGVVTEMSPAMLTRASRGLSTTCTGNACRPPVRRTYRRRRAVCPGGYAPYVRRTRTSLDRAIRTAYRVVHHRSPVGSGPRSERLLAAEKAVLAAGGCVVRLAGLYLEGRGAHNYWLTQEEVAQRPDGLINQVRC